MVVQPPGTAGLVSVTGSPVTSHSTAAFGPCHRRAIESRVDGPATRPWASMFAPSHAGGMPSGNNIGPVATWRSTAATTSIGGFMSPRTTSGVALGDMNRWRSRTARRSPAGREHDAGGIDRTRPQRPGTLHDPLDGDRNALDDGDDRPLVPLAHPNELGGRQEEPLRIV